ncbi:MAG: alpha-glucosidase C-terminal domain-containing protein [Lentisphaeria bacterium]|nr:alpha-glucosidase C-terminal domain-containing protein [Lentisphaeria bacterium]
MTNIRLTIKTIVLVSALTALHAGDEIIFSFDKHYHANKGGIHAREEIAGLETTGVQGKPQHAAVKMPENARFGSGIIGKALKIGVSPDGKKRYAYSYLPTKDLYTDRGAVMFWVKPENWNGNDKKFHLLFTANAPQNNIIIYKYQSRPDLFFFFNGKYTFCNIKDWKADKWHHVAAVWNAEELYIYVDGRLKKGIKTPKRTKTVFKNFTFGSVNNWKDETGETLIDEVRILPEFINEKAVFSEYTKNLSFVKEAKSPIEVQVAPGTPKLDGNLSVNEYGFASGGFYNIKTGKFAATQSRWAVAYDDKNLYFAMTTPVGKTVTAKNKKHDSNIWEDDSVEIHVMTSDTGKYQFIFNTIGGIYDHKNNNPAWNSKGIKTVSNIKNGSWTIECSIPLSNFEKINKPFFINLCRSFSDTREFTSASPVLFHYAQYRNFIKVIPAKKAPYIDILSMGDLNGKKLNFKVNIKNNLKEKIVCRFELNTDNKFLPYQEKRVGMVPHSGQQQFIVMKNNLPPNSTLSIDIKDGSGKMLYSSKFPYHDINPAVVHNLYVSIPRQTMFVAVKNYTPGMKKTLRVRFLDKNGKNIMTVLQMIKPDSFSELSFDISKIPFGMYDVHTDMLDANNKVFYTNYFPLHKTTNTPWWSNPTAGLGNGIPSPWTKPAASNEKYQCMYRTYGFSSNSLLGSLNIKGEEFLAAPVALKINQKAVSFKTKIQNSKKAPAVTKYVHSAVVSGISVNVEMEAEYDGLLRYTLKFKPVKEPVKLNSMVLEIPVKADLATSFDDCGSIFVKDDLLKSRGKIIYKNLVYRPFFRIGNMKTGLLGGMSSLRGWHIKDKTRSLSVNNRKDKVTVTLHFVDTPFVLKKERVIKFYLQATPIKPKINMEKSKKASLWTGYWTTVYDYKVDGYFDDKEIKKLEKKLAPGKEYHWYFTTAGASPFSPDWYYWGLNWHNDPPALGTCGADSDLSKRKKRDRNGWTYACMSSRSFLDFKLRTCTDAIMNRKYNVNNLYFDISWPKICWNKEHGCLWYDDFGDRMPTNDWEGNREFHERVYRTLKQKNPDGIITQHLLCGWTPADSFCDIIVAGEGYEMEIANKGHYFDCFKPRFMQLHYVPRSQDRDYWMIPQFLRAIILYKPAQLKAWKNDLPEVKKSIIHMIGALYVNGLNCWPLSGAEKYVNQSWKYRNKLSNTDYNFYPYWEKGGPVTAVKPENKTLMVSVYEKDGKYLVCVFNDSDKKCAAEVTLKGFNNKQGIEAFSEKTYTVNGNKLKVELSPRDFKYFYFDLSGNK